MQPSGRECRVGAGGSGCLRRDEAPTGGAPEAQELDLGLLEESLAKTPWERMQANDDALRFAEALRAAMEERNAG